MSMELNLNQGNLRGLLLVAFGQGFHSDQERDIHRQIALPALGLVVYGCTVLNSSSYLTFGENH